MLPLRSGLIETKKNSCYSPGPQVESEISRGSNSFCHFHSFRTTGAYHIRFHLHQSHQENYYIYLTFTITPHLSRHDYLVGPRATKIIKMVTPGISSWQENMTRW